MSIKSIGFSLLTMFTLISSIAPAHAQWYQTQGKANVVNGNVEHAKQKAMENALQKALLVAGASVSSVQQVVNGLLTKNQLNVRASGSVHSLNIIDETYEGDMVMVTIRADIFAQEQACFPSDYKKSLLVTRANILHREQANIGGIYDVEKSFMSRLTTSLNNNANYFAAKTALNKTDFSRLNRSMQQNKIVDLSNSLANVTNSQYVLYAEINDISCKQDANNNWQFWQYDEFDRYFDINLYLYNGSDGEQVFNKHYQKSAPWQFKKRELVDPSSKTFWHSLYGEALDEIIVQAVRDIDESMMCQESKARIIQVNGDQLTINLGRRHGVKMGDTFSLLHVEKIFDNNGHSYTAYQVSNFNAKVAHVSQQSAKLVSENGEIFGSIQVNDMAVRQ